MIELTDKAMARVRGQLAKRGSGIGIKVGVTRSGCSGYSYQVDFADAVAKGEVAAVYEDITVVVAEKDLPLIEGLRLDVKTQGLNQFFAFDNPRATATCGCGTSFSVE